MSEQSRGFLEWLDSALGRKFDAGDFARSAIGEVPKVETPVRLPTARRMWPPEVWAEMQAIIRGEKE